MTGALLDRLTHKAHIFLTTGESYRCRENHRDKQAKKASGNPKRKRR